MKLTDHLRAFMDRLMPNPYAAEIRRRNAMLDRHERQAAALRAFGEKYGEAALAKAQALDVEGVPPEHPRRWLCVRASDLEALQAACGPHFKSLYGLRLVVVAGMTSE